MSSARPSPRDRPLARRQHDLDPPTRKPPRRSIRQLRNDSRSREVASIVVAVSLSSMLRGSPLRDFLNVELPGADVVRASYRKHLPAVEVVRPSTPPSAKRPPWSTIGIA